MKTTFKRIASSICSVALATTMLVSTTVQASALSYDGSSSYESGKYYTNLTKVNLTGDQRKDIVNVAKSQIGYHEGNSNSQLSGQSSGSGNYTEYGKWYGMQDMWCAIFVSWCANTAGIDTSIVPKHSWTVEGLDKFIKNGQAYTRAEVASGKYTPQAGDIIYFKSARNSNKTNHVGIVTSYSNKKVYTVEGNESNAVKTKSYSITDTYIVYICKPAYKNVKATVTLNKSKLSLCDGNTETLKATINGTTGGTIKSWTSSDTKVAKVSSLGKVTAVAPGKATITVKLENGNKASCTVTVTKATVKLNKSTLSLGEGGTYTLQATTTGSKITSWTSSDTKVATVTSSGKVTAVAQGKATITVKLANGNKATCTVTVTKATVTLDKSSLSLYDGQTYTLKATKTGSKITSWTSSNTKVATVTSSGKVTAVAPGKATITVKLANGNKATCTVTVTKSTVKLNKSSLTMKKGSTSTLTATVTGGSKITSWKSSNTKVATVTSSGKVTAVAAGKATITVTLANGNKATCVITVSNVSYFPKCASSYTSVVDALKSIKVDSSYAYRKKIATANGISNYSGSASQNSTMLNLLKNGKLIKP